MLKNMKKYIDAQLQVVRINKNDVIATSTLGMSNTSFSDESSFEAPNHFRDWDAGY